MQTSAGSRPFVRCMTPPTTGGRCLGCWGKWRDGRYADSLLPGVRVSNVALPQRWQLFLQWIHTLRHVICMHAYSTFSGTDSFTIKLRRPMNVYLRTSNCGHFITGDIFHMQIIGKLFNFRPNWRYKLTGKWSCCNNHKNLFVAITTICLRKTL